jgi:hypothetical protein
VKLPRAASRRKGGAGNVVDLPRARRALAALDRLAEAHPEAFRLNEQQWRAVLAEGESMTVSKVVPVRLSDAMIKRIDAHAARLRELTGLEPSRSDVVRLLVERGLSAVESASAELQKARSESKGKKRQE